jgi:hypothetical protein
VCALFIGCSGAIDRPPTLASEMKPDLVCEDACTILKLNLCSEYSQDCEPFCRRVEGSNVLSVHAKCVVQSRTMDELNKCGVKCYAR